MCSALTRRKKNKGNAARRGRFHLIPVVRPAREVSPRSRDDDEQTQPIRQTAPENVLLALPASGMAVLLFARWAAWAWAMRR